MQMQDAEKRLVTLIIDELLKEGGSCSAHILITLNPTVRKFLGDRKLVSYLSGALSYIWHCDISFITYV